MKKKTIIILSVIAVIVLGIIAGCAIIANMNSDLDALRDLSIEDADLSKIPDGVYPGSYDASLVSVEVEVTVADHQITAIDLVKHSNGKGKAAEELPAKVVDSQSLDVDTVSGATYSSIVILKAIENALAGAA